jgi:hypothetical protein
VTKLIDRAPDNQPTENLRNMVAHARRDLAEWERTRETHRQAVVRQTRIIARSREALQRLEDQLAIRLQEEQEAVEVNGL